MNFNYTSLKNYNQDVGRSRLYCKFYLGVLVYLIVLYASGIISPADTFHKLRSSSSTGPIQYFAVWSYPFPPPKVELDDEERLYCSYSPCAPTNEDLNFYKAPYIINLRQLVSPKVSRPFDEFIQHHMWWKFVHGNNFPHHVQSVAILSLLMTRRRACVRTLGRDRSETVCTSDLEAYNHYDPTNVNSVPPFSVQYIDMPTSYGILDYHSGDLTDEMQSLSTLQFFPFLTNIVDTRIDFPQVHGKFHLMMNGSFRDGIAFPPSLGDDTFVTMLSMHIEESFRDIVDDRVKVFMKYNSAFGAIGAMDSETASFFRSKGLNVYLSSSFTSMLNVSSMGSGKEIGTGQQILIVDYQDDSGIPADVLNSAVSIQSTCPEDLLPRERMQKAFELIKQISEARLVICFKVQVAMIAMAHGVPVILVGGLWDMGTDAQGNSFMFHRHIPGEQWGYNVWTLTENPPAGVHLFDRRRASFLNHIKKRSLLYYDTANLFGMLPLQRLGKGVIDPTHDYEQVDEIQFVISTPADTMTWRIVTSLEAVFFFHPNAKVIIYSNSIPKRDTMFDIFVEAGYDLDIKNYSFTGLLKSTTQFLEDDQRQLFLKRLETQVKQQHWWVHEADLVRLLILEQRGGVMMDTDLHLLQPIPSSFMNVVGWTTKDYDKIGTAFVAFEAHNPFLQKVIVDAVDLNNNHYDKDSLNMFGSEIFTSHILEKQKGTEDVRVLANTIFYPYGEDSSRCFTDNKDVFYPIADEFSFAVHMNTKEKEEIDGPSPGSVCDKIIQDHCLLCDEIRTDTASKS